MKTSTFHFHVLRRRVECVDVAITMKRKVRKSWPALTVLLFISSLLSVPGLHCQWKSNADGQHGKASLFIMSLCNVASLHRKMSSKLGGYGSHRAITTTGHT